MSLNTKNGNIIGQQTNTTIQKDKFLFNIKDYQIQKEIMSDFYSIVYLIKNKSTKTLYTSQTNYVEIQSQNQEYISKEIQILSLFHHQTISHWYGYSCVDFNGEKNVTFLMDFIDGHSLLDYINTSNKTKIKKKLDNTTKQKILVGISLGMALLHRAQIIHRDLKPKSIILDSKMEPKITNFGFYKIFLSENATIGMNTNRSNLPYIAPEVLKCDQYSFKSDVYSFGVLMYDVIMGTQESQNLFGKGDIVSLEHNIMNGIKTGFSDDIKHEIRMIIDECLSESPNDRPTFAEIFNELISSTNLKSLFDENDYESVLYYDFKEDDTSKHYCLDNVDHEEFVRYVYKILSEASEQIKIFDEQIKKHQISKTSSLSNINYKNQVINCTITLKHFNTLPIRIQQKVITKLISTTIFNIFPKRVNDLMIYLIKYDKEGESRPFLRIISSYDNMFLSNIGYDCDIYISSCIIEKILKEKSCFPNEFTSLLSTFKTVYIELKYPSNWYKNAYNYILKIKMTNLKIAVLITGISKTFYNFTKDNNIQYVVIDQSVTMINGEDNQKNGSFGECASLKRIEINSQNLKIGSFAFHKCKSLTDILFNNHSSLISIDEYAFCGCSSLKKIFIPSSVISIQNHTFMNCICLTQVIFDIQSSLISIEQYAFNGCNMLRQIMIPSSVISIKSYAFSNCSSLLQISFMTPSSLTSIESNAFIGCPFEQIEIPPLVTTINDNTFMNCTRLKKIKLPSSVTSIGDCAFMGCSSLKKIKIPDSVKTIGKKAFKKCTLLEKISIPPFVETIKFKAFSKCVSLKEVHMLCNSSLKSIGDGCFKCCSLLQKISIPSSVCSFGKSVFYNCKSLKQILFNNESCIKQIEDSAFYKCTTLEEITIPSSVISIGEFAFSLCSSLHLVSFEYPSSLKEIKFEAFRGCSSLYKIVFPEKLVYIHSRAFYECSLAEVIFPPSINIIGDEAFDKCTFLSEIEFYCKPKINNNSFPSSVRINYKVNNDS